MLSGFNGCGSSSSDPGSGKDLAVPSIESPACGDTLIWSVNTGFQTLNPLIASDSVSLGFCTLFYDSLLKLDYSSQLSACLAETWEVSADRRVIVFRLKQGVTWHDGKPFTASDVAFNLRLIESGKSPAARFFTCIDTFEVTDRYTLTVRLNSPSYSVFQLFLLPLVAQNALNPDDFFASEEMFQPVGTGPFIVQEFIKDEKIELIANKSYHDGRPYLDRILIRIIPSQSSIFNLLKTHETDLAELTLDQFLKQADTDVFRSYYNLYNDRNSFVYTFVGWNLTHSLLSRLEVRKAISYAVDRERMCREALMGFHEPMNGPYPEYFVSYDNSLPKPEFNVKKAREILAGEGFSDSDGDGILELEENELRFTVLVIASAEKYLLTAQFLASSLEQIGCRMEIIRLPYEEIMQRVMQRKFDSFILNYTYAFDYNLRSLWHSSMIPSETNGYRGFNVMGYTNPELDQLIDEMDQSFDQKRRDSIYREMQKIVTSDQAQLFLYMKDAPVAVDKRFRNVHQDGLSRLHRVTRWYVPEALQKYRE
ncbi:MAG: ABC transporter substrate-binding protein [Candidatus Wallbacteria bacterium]|nr:ABC transporter substrate-binding protein [Candidatus Wallbacteria bacterium]